ncbi:hypothetical protein [Desulfosporosinus lacus]|uniref:Flagellin n=1 Tax=Desulfosporosinus lacus DSM 15449 TaxID=1121420 RepID=A0A1M5UWA0_9FIRM|nr:hypothetical protein [Desulfosporosinus lacus]SHH67148.1 flagellin N-terminal helical region [Desulfosporosinus lacus DSM 15449]
MRINNNTSALNTFHVLAINEATAAKSLKRLSSGLRINQAADDVAGLAISEDAWLDSRLKTSRSERSGWDIPDSNSGRRSCPSIHNMLQRGRELAVRQLTERSQIRTEAITK